MFYTRLIEDMSPQLRGTPDEFVEVQRIVNQAAKDMAALLRKSAPEHPPEALEQMARCEFDFAAHDFACLVFGSPLSPRNPS